MGRKFWLSWLAYVTASWIVLNLLAAPEYVRVWGFSEAMPRTLASVALPFSGLAVADFRVYSLIRDLWPCVSLLAWKLLSRDRSFMAGVKGAAFAIVLAEVSGNVVAAASPHYTGFVSGLDGALYWVVRTLAIALAFNTITVLASRLRIRFGRKDAVEPALRPDKTRP